MLQTITYIWESGTYTHHGFFLLLMYVCSSTEKNPNNPTPAGKACLVENWDCG